MSIKKVQKLVKFQQKLASRLFSPKYNQLISILLLSILSSIVLIAYGRDETKEHNLYILIAWLTLVAVSLQFGFTSISKSSKELLTNIVATEWKVMLLIFLFSLFLRTILLSTYPYVAIGDELREIGLNAYNFSSGINHDYFQLGSYSGYTYIFSLPGLFFRSIFGGTALTYRLPSAIIGSLAATLTFIIGYKWKGRSTGIIAALFIASSTIHLHESRTEFIISSSSFVSAVIFLAVVLANKDRTATFLWGLFYGLAMHAYVGVRPVMLIMAVVFAVSEVSRLLHCKQKAKFLKVQLTSYLKALIGFVIGFGPSILVPKFLTSSGSGNLLFTSPQFINNSLHHKLEILADLYKKSFGIYFYEGTTANFHFPGHGTLLDFPVSSFFIIGLVAIILIKAKSFYTKSLLVLIFLAPFLNQVIVGEPGEEHRVLSIMPFAMAISTLGLYRLCENFDKYKNHLLIITVSFSVFFSTFNYFFLRLSDKSLQEVNNTEFAFEFMVNHIQSQDPGLKYYIIYTDNTFPVQYLHYQEKLRYSVAEYNVDILNSDEIETKFPNGIKENTTILLYDDLPSYVDDITYQIVVDCKLGSIIPNYKCPPWTVSNTFEIFVAEY